MTQEKSLPLIPVRMLNEFAYCPRLFYLEWVQGEFEDSVDTLQGKFVHRRVDRKDEIIASAEELEEEDGIQARSVTMESERIGIIAKMDIIEGQGGEICPVDYKKGTVPENENRSYEPERVQICAQALILRENGYNCSEGVIYYAGSKTRIPIIITDELVSRTLQLVEEAKQTAENQSIPPPLVDSPKCPRCSLVGICLPDEVTVLSNIKLDKMEADNVRQLTPARDDALPLYVQEQGAIVTKKGEELEVRSKKDTIATAKLFEISSLSLFGNVQVTTQAVHELCMRGIPICYFSFGGWFYGITGGMVHKNVVLRQCQYKVAADEQTSLPLARRIVCSKIRNCRTLLRRNCEISPVAALHELARLAQGALKSESLDELLGIEGAAARVYYSHFQDMLKAPAVGFRFDFHTRNRRPPKDPVNALLSFAYALLASTATVTLMCVGFDPYLGFLHRPRYGRPSLALDLMEEFRPLIADSTVISLINNKEIAEEDMLRAAGAVAMTSDARKKVIHAYERRLETLISHPLFGYSISYRRVLEVQARLLGRTIMKEIKEYPMFLTR
ncbi:MAG: CRISPR-associated endonuclease Cas1 [Methanomassiliicoccales archaeon]